jgi:uncharacterized membrane protein YhaH (DUF805 family)
MKFSDLWTGRTGRLPYLSALIGSSAAIAVLPFIAAAVTMAFASVDPALAILRSLLRVLILGIGFFLAGVPLVLFTRRRMRELGLSGAWLLLFPIAPLQTLFAFAFAIASSTSQVTIWSLPITSPVATPAFWFEFTFGALLAVLPAGNYLERSPSRLLRFAHAATTCDGRLNRQTFALRLAIALGPIVILPVVTALLARTGGLLRPGAHSASILASPVLLVSGLLTVFVMMFVTSTTIRRLHDLNRQGWWIVFFPLGLPSLAAASVFLLNPLVFLRLHLFVLFSTVQGLGCLVLLALLLFKQGSDFNNPYGRPIHRGDGAYVPV